MGMIAFDVQEFSSSIHVMGWNNENNNVLIIWKKSQQSYLYSADIKQDFTLSVLLGLKGSIGEAASTIKNVGPRESGPFQLCKYSKSKHPITDNGLILTNPAIEIPLIHLSVLRSTGMNSDEFWEKFDGSDSIIIPKLTFIFEDIPISDNDYRSYAW
jgi:hypothetical protein